MKESELQKIVLEWLKINRYKCWKNYLGPLFIKGGQMVKNPNSGQPDIYVISKKIPGKLIAIELKSQKGKLSDKQKTEINELETAGVIVIIAKSLNYIIQIFSEENL